MTDIAAIPMQFVGPIKIVSDYFSGEVTVPLATFESPLWLAVNRGARVSRIAKGITVTLIDDRMTRSILMTAKTAKVAASILSELKHRRAEIAVCIAKSSQFARFVDMHFQIVGPLIWVRLECETGDAAGHNMVTKASDLVIDWLLNEYKELTYVSISGNFCTDKKVSAVNGILGRGKSVIAELFITKKECMSLLKTTPELIAEINMKKNWIGSNVAGSLRTANAHFANILLGFYLATGQDAANLIEGSQGFTYAELREDGLYFSVTLPHLIVGTVGSGKTFPFVEKNLKHMGCLVDQERPGYSARKLAVILAATVCCGELSLLAAQTNRGELVRSHMILERKKRKDG